MNQAYDQDVLHLSLLYPYSNHVLANGRGAGLLRRDQKGC